ncbi:HNH endonuclease [Stenotrophomonas maltophilia]|uniref:HNH endonuclease signature motif containing protein n=1 Tax=Stenotrophomonas TaxID=40323 RepID=UPI0018D35165|nr:HNH endonuclease signature motif containing protein [Stenotrophomonas maltophilia]MBH1851893.1 HNH endonuclease [Stenotrophomonas maltophilia]
MNELTCQRLKNILDYDELTGLFQWVAPPKVHPSLKSHVAGGISNGYVVIKIDGRKYRGHRLAWLYVHGKWPSGDLDHINGCPLDNRIENLRIATNPQNQANRRRDRGKDTPKGVRRLPSGRFQARISVSKELHHLGTFDTAEEAQAAYIAAARNHYQEYARSA